MKWLRWLWRWLSGEWARVPPRWTEEEIERLSLLNRARFAEWAKKQPSGSLLTGMVVALICGPSPRLEPSHAYARDRTRRTQLKRGMPIRIVGKPLIYKSRDTTIGETQWASDYIPRKEQLQAKKMAKRALRSLVRMAA